VTEYSSFVLEENLHSWSVIATAISVIHFRSILWAVYARADQLEFYQNWSGYIRAWG